SIMAVGAQQDLDLWPMVAQGADQTAHKAADLYPARPLARPQHGGDKAAFPIKDDDWLETVIVMVGIEQAELLSTMDPVERVVDIDHNALRHCPERTAILIDERPPKAQQRSPIGQVFQPRDGR